MALEIRKTGYLRDIQDEMNRILEDAFNGLDIVEDEALKERPWCPAVELNEQNGNYRVKAELPGVNKDDIDVEVGEDTVTIKGETREKAEEKKENVYRSEIRYGKFMRLVQLPSMVDNSQVKASFKDGILTITLPKTGEEERKTKKVTIHD